MRQFLGLKNVIHRNTLTEYYSDLAIAATVQKVKIPSLDEFLNLALNNKGDAGSTTFDAKTDQKLSDFALRRLKERQAKHGR